MPAAPDLSEILCVGPYSTEEECMARSKKPPPPFAPELLDALAADLKTPADLDALFRQMKKALVERALSAELTHHLGYPAGAPKPAGQPNHRNGTTPKTVLTDTDRLPLEVPRDRAGSFTPSSCRRACAGYPASIRRCSRSTPGDSRCARSAATWRSSTRWRWRPT